jgi:simple sugar transport system permease protein
MAYIISLTSVPIKNELYKAISLTPIYIPFFPTYIYVTTLVGPIKLLVAIYLSFFTRFGRSIYAIGSNEQSAN